MQQKQYFTVMQSPQYHQMSLEDFLFSTPNPQSNLINDNTTNTRTYVRQRMGERINRVFDIRELLTKLTMFNQNVEHLRKVDRAELYTTFHIPKRSGGLRRIDAPNENLMNSLRELKTIFEEDFRVLYHTSAFAYVKGRSTIDAVKRHQKNESKWFGKFDLSNFFGSTTLNFVMQQFSMIFPFSKIVAYPLGETELRKALELAFFNGGLPQGTPISPLITNVMMIPVDHMITNGLRDFENQSYTYTRYADDFIISSKYDFKVRDIEKWVVDILSEFNAPFTIRADKTRYGSSAGRNWNLGVMLNKDNEITIGHKKKRQFQSMLYNYIRDKKNGSQWDLQDVQVMNGLRSYYLMVEPTAIKNIIKHINEKMDVDVVRMIKADLCNNED